MILLDALGAGGSGVSVRGATSIREQSEAKLTQLCAHMTDVDETIEANVVNNTLVEVDNNGRFGIPPFFIARGEEQGDVGKDNFNLQAPVCFKKYFVFSSFCL